MQRPILALSLALVACPAFAAPPLDPSAQHERIDVLAAQIEPRVVAWRRDIHQHPELGNQETRTAALVAEHLTKLGLEVETGVAVTGVVGILRGAVDGPVVALRADMDALPVTEPEGLPFASKRRETYLGRDVGVMHACGHDSHVAVLMGVAEVLAKLGSPLPGTVKFLFQPAEEGIPEPGTWGAAGMVAEGVLENPRPEAVFALHATHALAAGQISFSAGPQMASSDRLRIVVRGRQTHGAMPWYGVDPITVAAQIILGLQTVVSRNVDLTQGAAVVSIGKISGGVRSNIIPSEVEMIGTIRALDEKSRRLMHARVEEVATHIATSAGATAEVEVGKGYPVTSSDAALVARITPTALRLFAEEDVLRANKPTTGAEDFSFFSREIPAVYFGLGVRDPKLPVEKAAPNHSPDFRIDETALLHGVRLLSHVTFDVLQGD
jgi:amidohydrolase